MRKLLNLNAGLIVLLWLACGIINAQNYNLKTEVLVYILSDSLELPVYERGKFSLQHAKVKSPALASALTKAKVMGIAKAFPAWIDKDSIIIRYDGQLVQSPPFHRIFTLTFNSEMEADKSITVLKKSAAVIFAEKHTEPTLDNDPFYMNGTQWNLNNYGSNGGFVGADINAEGAWAIYTGSSSNKIAIIDTGVELTHEDLIGKVTGESPFGGTNHGTMVAGIAAAKANNFLGIRGIDWNAQIISKNIGNANGNYIGDAAVAQKIIDAVNEGANVLNRSGSSPDYSSTLAMAFAYAYKMDRISVATMGNTSNQQVRYPAALPNVIAVGATQNNDFISNFSTTGNHIDVVAPGGVNVSPFCNGQDIYTTDIGNNYNFTSGTSFSAPQVTGLASLMKGYKPTLSNDDIRQIIRLSADDRGALGFDSQYGYGRVNAGRAMSYLVKPYAVVQNTTSSGTITNTSDPFDTQFISATGLPTNNYLVKRIEIQKTISLPENLYNILGVWGRGAFTTGWHIGTPNYGEGLCEVVPGSLTSTNVTLRTNVYQVWNIGGSYLGYHPASPIDAIFAYSVLGLEKPTISGSSNICNQATYTIQNFPEYATVSWIGSKALNIISGQGTSSIVCQKTMFAIDGTTLPLRVLITLSTGQTMELTKDIFVGTYPPAILLCPTTYLPPFVPHVEYGYTNEVYYLFAHGENMSDTAADYLWKSYSPESSVLGTGRYIEFSKSNPGEYKVSVQYNGECGWSAEIFRNIRFEDILNVNLYPNPVTDILTAELTSNQTKSSAILHTSTANFDTYTIQFWSEYQGHVRSFEIVESKQQLSLQGLPSGMYIALVVKDGKTLQRKIVWKN